MHLPKCASVGGEGITITFLCPLFFGGGGGKGEEEFFSHMESPKDRPTPQKNFFFWITWVLFLSFILFFSIFSLFFRPFFLFHPSSKRPQVRRRKEGRRGDLSAKLSAAVSSAKRHEKKKEKEKKVGLCSITRPDIPFISSHNYQTSI